MVQPIYKKAGVMRRLLESASSKIRPVFPTKKRKKFKSKDGK